MAIRKRAAGWIRTRRAGRHRDAVVLPEIQVEDRHLAGGCGAGEDVEDLDGNQRRPALDDGEVRCRPGNTFGGLSQKAAVTTPAIRPEKGPDLATGRVDGSTQPTDTGLGRAAIEPSKGSAVLWSFESHDNVGTWAEIQSPGHQIGVGRGRCLADADRVELTGQQPCGLFVGDDQHLGFAQSPIVAVLDQAEGSEQGQGPLDVASRYVRQDAGETP